MLSIEFTENGLRLTSDDREAENAWVADALNEGDQDDGYGEAYDIWDRAPFDGTMTVEFDQSLVLEVCEKLLEFNDDGGKISAKMSAALKSAPEHVREALV